jgi:hypothetical protein
MNIEHFDKGALVVIELFQLDVESLSNICQQAFFTVSIDALRRVESSFLDYFHHEAIDKNRRAQNHLNRGQNMLKVFLHGVVSYQGVDVRCAYLVRN